jgi:hemerythrin-like domain-containing protein
MKITEILMAEHTVFYSLFDHIEAALPKAKTLAVVKALAVTMDTLTKPHSETEDELFIKPLEHYFDQIGHQATFHDEHEIIEQSLAEVLKTKNLKLAKKLLLAAVTASRSHFEKEERIIFPWAERVLKTRTLTELGKQWQTQRDGKMFAA